MKNILPIVSSVLFVACSAPLPPPPPSPQKADVVELPVPFLSGPAYTVVVQDHGSTSVAISWGDPAAPAPDPVQESDIVRKVKDYQKSHPDDVPLAPAEDHAMDQMIIQTMKEHGRVFEYITLTNGQTVQQVVEQHEKTNSLAKASKSGH
jgi:hypothetical protein